MPQRSIIRISEAGSVYQPYLFLIGYEFLEGVQSSEELELNVPLKFIWLASGGSLFHVIDPIHLAGILIRAKLRGFLVAKQADSVSGNKDNNI